MALDDGLENLEIRNFRGYAVKDSTILEEQVLFLIKFMDEKINFIPIINNQVRYMTLAIILQLHQGIQVEVPVLL